MPKKKPVESDSDSDSSDDDKKKKQAKKKPVKKRDSSSSSSSSDSSAAGKKKKAPAKKPQKKKRDSSSSSSSSDSSDSSAPKKKPAKKKPQKKRDSSSSSSSSSDEKSKKKPAKKKPDAKPDAKKKEPPPKEQAKAAALPLPDPSDKAKKDKKDKKDKKEKKKPMPIVGEILNCAPVPKKDKLKKCKVGIGNNFRVSSVEIITNATNIQNGLKIIVALPGVTTANGVLVEPRKVGGVDSEGMLCGPLEMGWGTDVLPEDLPIVLAKDAEPGSAPPSYDDVVAAAKAQAAKADSAQVDAKAPKGQDKKGKKANKQEEKKAADAEFDELMAEMGGGDAPPVEDSKAAGKKKKKGAKGAKDDDDDLDAALAEAGLAAPEPAKEEPPPVEAPPKSDDPSSTPAGDAKAEEPAAEDKQVDAKTLANRAKKLRKKAAAAGGGGFYGSDEPKADETKVDEPKVNEPVADAAADAKPDPKAKAKGKAKAKAVSAKVAALAQAAEEARKLEEEKQAFIAAEMAKRAEEDARLQKEKEEAEARAEAKRKAKADKIAQQKADGTYQTKKDKANAARARELRKQFGFSVGDEEGEVAADADAGKKRAKPAGKLKKKPEKKTDAGDEEVRDEGDEPAVDAAAKPDEDDAGDDWEILEDEGKDGTAKGKDDAEADDDDASEGDDDSDDEVVSYRSPILVIMGHVDTGKTKLLDKIRRTNVQAGEAGGITQQIGATFFPDIALYEQTKQVDEDFEIEVPGLLIIDTPGHESFNNLRTRGSSLCDFAILVIDIMHGLEPQTVESLELLKKRKCPFLIAMNKIDMLYQFKCDKELAVQKVLEQQQDNVKSEFRDRLSKIQLQLAERGLNTALYWENDDYQRNISIVPTSAITGVGVPDLLYMVMYLPQTLISESLEVDDELECTVIEVKNIDGMGTTIDVVLKNGKLEEGDQIVVAGLGEPIVTTIRALLTPQPMREMRVKGDYIHHKKITTSMGIKIQATGLEHAVAGSELLVVGPDDDLEELKDEILESMEEGTGTLADFERAEEGVYVKASTLGSLEALLAFLEEMKIPVFDVSIGDITRKDVTKASLMKSKSHPEYAIILAFDVKIRPDAKAQAEKDGIEVFLAEIIYHLFDKFTAYMDKIKEAKKVELKDEKVFPVIVEIDKQCIFRQKDPMIFGVRVIDGQLRIGTPLCVAEKETVLEIGRVAGIEIDRKPVEKARKGKAVCIKIAQNTAQQHISYGRHFDHSNKLISRLTRKSIDTLKEQFADEMIKEDWQLVIGLKKVLKIQ